MPQVLKSDCNLKIGIYVPASNLNHSDFDVYHEMKKYEFQIEFCHFHHYHFSIFSQLNIKVEFTGPFFTSISWPEAPAFVIDGYHVSYSCYVLFNCFGHPFIIID